MSGDLLLRSMVLGLSIAAPVPGTPERAVPLVVDAAWAAHFGFPPGSDQ